MSKPPLKRRTYGYLEKNNERTTHTHGEEKKPPVKTHKTSKYSISNILLVILLLPFKIIGWIFKKIFSLFKVSKQTGKELRKKFFGFIAVCFALGILGMTILVAWAGKDLPDPDRLTDRQIAQSTKIYDRTGEHLLYEIFADQKRTMVEFDKIPKQLINAVVATEDTAFYEHKGIRPLSIIRSVVYGLIGKSRLGSGASTLTQQLVKNAILTNERTYTRKIKEIILSIRLEQKYSKDQILKIYFNEIPYGSTNYGVESAAHSYFNKSVSELNLEEIATLAGLPKAPSTYINNKTALKKRRDFVLERMFEEGYITRQEADETQAKPVSLSQEFGKIQAPHFVLYVKEQLVEMFGEQMVDTGGLKVITTLDWDKQQAAEQAVKEESDKTFAESEANNASLVAIDPKTGQILAMIGSRDFYDDKIDGQFNVATLGKRQPGSSFKPIVYAAAFEKGYTPDTLLFDVETNFAVAGKDYKPLNYDLKEHGIVTMRQALQGSLNIPAVQTLYLVGAEKGVDFAERMGYTTLSEGDFGLSLVLGGGEVKLLEHVNAYGIFANNGIYQKHVSILNVEDNAGTNLFEWKKNKGEQVLDEKVAATMSNVLSDDAARSYVFGSGSILTLKDRPVAAKTGTTNGYIDAWTIGYTPSLVSGVWVGNTNNTPMRKGDGGSKLAAPIWNHFMREALKNTPAEEFPTPPPNDAQKPILRGSSGAGIKLLVDKVTGKIATSSTPADYIIEQTFIPPHSILHYVTKDDPRGPAPADPTQDPQYAVWEQAIQDWVAREKAKDPNWNITFGEPPTESDDIHSIELAPTLDVFSPAPSSTLGTRQINVEIRVSAPRGVTKVTYKIDENYVGTIKDAPFNLNYYATGLNDGDHILTVIAEDDIGNQSRKDIPFTLAAGVEQPVVLWTEKEMTLNQSDFPRVFFLRQSKLDQIKTVVVYKQRIGGDRSVAGTINPETDLFNNQLMFNWNSVPEQGEWELTAQITLKNNLPGNTDKTKIIIK